MFILPTNAGQTHAKTMQLVIIMKTLTTVHAKWGLKAEIVNLQSTLH